jgi:Ca2+-binding RTX toxin-like protein
MPITEPNNTIADANNSELSLDGERIFEDSGNIESREDQDLIRFQLEEGDVAIIDVDVIIDINVDLEESQNSLDSRLRIFDADGEQLQISQVNTAVNETISTAPYLEFTAEDAGDYYAGVSGLTDYNPVTGEVISSFVFDPGDYDISITLFNGIEGTSSRNTLAGTIEADYITGLDGNDTLTGDDGDDFLKGGDFNDLLVGGDGNDILLGEDNNDNLQGGNGDDILRGGGGSDVLTGGEGADQFILNPTQTGETILDFQAEDDLLILTGDIGFSEIDITASSGNAVITFGSITVATIEDVATNVLTEDVFIF